MMRLFPFIIGLVFFISTNIFPQFVELSWGVRLTTEEKVETPSAPSKPETKKKPEAVPTIEPENLPAGSGENLSSVTMNFIDMDIRELIRLISERTGKNFIIDERVKGKVTVIAPKPISPEMAYRVFLSILEVHGYRVVPSGSVNKIVPAIFARQQGVETFDGNVPMEIEGSDKIITQMIPLQYANVDQVKNLLIPMVSKESIVLSYSDNNMLIITDLASNIKRLLKIIREIDIEGLEERLHIRRLNYAVASELADLITSLMSSTSHATTVQPQTQTRSRTPVTPTPFRSALQAARISETVKVLSDERTNTLIILAGPKSSEMIMDLITKLDIETPKGRGRIHVYYLKHANAEEMVNTLTQLPVQRTQQTTARTTLAARTTQAAATAATPMIAGINITADKPTNSLIITATPEDFEMLVSVIEKLDIPRLQVFIEALFVEIKADQRLDLGVEWSAFGNPSIDNYEGVVGGSMTTTSNLAGILGSVAQGSPPQFPGGFSLGLLGEAFNFGEVSITSLSALINLLKSMSNVEILSTPQILTMDNEEAKIVVSTNVPYTVSSTTDTSNIDNTVRTFAYRDVGVTLTATPSITKNKFIRLKLFQEVSSLVSAVTGTGDTAELAPTTLKRQAETVVVVRDNSTIVIGGLIGEQMNRSESMAPCLGEIPWVGWLFRTTTDQSEKTNLLIFLTPHIIDTPEKVESLYNKKHETIMKEKAKHKPRNILPENPFVEKGDKQDSN